MNRLSMALLPQVISNEDCILLKNKVSVQCLIHQLPLVDNPSSHYCLLYKALFDNSVTFVLIRVTWQLVDNM